MKILIPFPRPFFLASVNDDDASTNKAATSNKSNTDVLFMLEFF